MTNPNDQPPPSSQQGNPFPVGHGSVHGTPAGAPLEERRPPTPRRRAARSWTTGVIAIGSVIVVGAAAFGLMSMAGGAGHQKLPLEARRLPPETHALSEQQLEASREQDATVRRPLLASELGTLLCNHGATDPAHALMRLGESGAIAAKTFFKPRNLEDVEELLDCGAALARGLVTPFVTEIAWSDGEKEHEVTAAQLGVDELPVKAGFFRQSFSGIPGYCYVKRDAAADREDDKRLKERDKSRDKDRDKDKDKDRDKDKDKDESDECGEAAFAALHEGNRWFFGKRAALELFAHALKRPRSELSSVVEILQDAADATRGLAIRRVQVRPKSALQFLSAACDWPGARPHVKGDDFRKACFPSSVERIIDAIDARTRAAAWEVDPDLERAEGFYANVVLVARDAEAAKEMQKDVDDLLRDWKSHLENNKGKVARLANKDPQSIEERVWLVVVDRFVAAIQSARVTRSGRTVKLAVSEKLSGAELRELKDTLGGARKDAKRAATAKVLEAIQASRPLPEDPLADLVGAKWAAYLAATHSELTDNECKKIKARLDDVSIVDLPKESIAIAGTIRKLDCYKKNEMADSVKACLLAVTDGESFAKCKLIEEPTEKDFGTKKADW